jgi:hypothetical protein
MGLAIATSLTLVFATVLIHYEGLRLVSRSLQAVKAMHSRRKVMLSILWIFLIHLVEIGIYAFSYWFGDVVIDIGSFAGGRQTGLSDYFFFSAEAFSTAGLGDIYPVGPLRLLASIEPINGILLIGWSTSFTFLGMQHYWLFDEAGADST